MVSPVVVTGTVVVSVSAGRVGVAVSAGVVVSTDTNTMQVKGGAVKQSAQTLDYCKEDTLITPCLFKRLVMWSFSYMREGQEEHMGEEVISNKGRKNQKVMRHRVFKYTFNNFPFCLFASDLDSKVS